MPAPDGRWQFEAIGTGWQIDGAGEARGEVSETISVFDRIWSRFRADSTVTSLATNGGSAVTGPVTGALFDLYHQLHDLTGGAVNPLVGGTLAGLGYDADLSLRPSAEVVTPSLDILSWTDDSVTLAAPALIDIGAAGKGLLVDLVAEVIGTNSYTVDAGGDLVHSGGQPLRVALEHPGDADLAIGVVDLGDGALAASATNRRAWGPGLHHVIDARTGRPTREVVATWVLADSAVVADALATALFFAPGEAVSERFGCEWVQMMANGEVRWSPRWPGEVFAA